MRAEQYCDCPILMIDEFCSQIIDGEGWHGPCGTPSRRNGAGRRVPGIMVPVNAPEPVEPVMLLNYDYWMTFMTRRIPTLFAGLLLWVLCAWPRLSAQPPRGEEVPPPAQSNAPASNVLNDIRVVEGKDRYRVALMFDQVPPFTIQEPDIEQPLRLQMGNTALAEDFAPQIARNRLIRKLAIKKQSDGKATLEVDLSSSKVRVSPSTLRSEGILILDIILEPGIALPPLEELADEQRDEAPQLMATPVAAPRQTGPPRPSLPPLDLALPKPEDLGVADPEAREKLQYQKMTSIENVDTALSQIVGALTLDFPNARALWDAFEERGDYERALDLGLISLVTPQSRESLTNLLYLIAESRYRLDIERDGSNLNPDPNWAETLNYYQQFLRFAGGTRFEPLARYRISQIYGRLEHRQEQLAMLHSLWKDKAPFSADVLLETAQLAVALGGRNQGPDHLLDIAEEALNRYRELDVDPDRKNLAGILLGEIAYRKGDDLKAYDTIIQVLQQMVNRRFVSYPDVYEHFFLAAHRLGQVDLVTPKTQNDRMGRRILGSSMDPEVRMTYANILAEGGDEVEAMKQYIGVALVLPSATEQQKIDARYKITRMRLEDALNNQVRESVDYYEYTRPVETLKELLDQTFDLKKRNQILADMVRHLRTMGKDIEAIRLILPYLREDRLPTNMARELSQTIWDVLPEAIQHFRQEGDYLFALQVLGSFGQYLEDHPQKDELVLEVARILLEAELPQQAEEVLEKLSPYRELTPEQKQTFTLFKREIALDPNKPQEFKETASTILEGDFPDATKARVLRLLAEIFEKEGNHLEAGQTFLKGARLTDIPWQQRLTFFESAAGQYEAVPNYAKILEVALEGLRFFDSLEIGRQQAPESVGNLLMMLGENFERLGEYHSDPAEYERAIRAYQSYLEKFPGGAYAGAAQFGLAKLYEKQGKYQKALEQYDALAAKRGGAFWSSAARKSADHLRWQQEHPYLIPYREKAQ